MLLSKRCLSILLLIPLLALLSGCWDQREIEERTSVVAIGIDKAKKPGWIRASVQIPIPIKIAGGGGVGGGGKGGKEAVRVMSADGRTLVEAFALLQDRLNQELFYGHTRVIAIGESVARDGVGDIIDPFRRDPQIRRLLWPVIVKGKAVDLLQANPQLEQIPTVFILSMFKNGARTGRMPDMTLGKFFIAHSDQGREPYLNYVRVKKNDIRWEGIAVFKKDKMIGTLNDHQAWEIMRFSEKGDGGPIVFPYRNNDKKILSFSTKYIRTKKHFSYKNGKIHVRILVKMEGDLLGKTFKTDFSKQPEIHNLEQGANAYLEKETKQTLELLQVKYKSDIIGIGREIRAYHPKMWSKLRWDKDFPKADIQVTYHVNLRRTGMEMQ